MKERTLAIWSPGLSTPVNIIWDIILKDTRSVAGLFNPNNTTFPSFGSTINIRTSNYCTCDFFIVDNQIWGTRQKPRYAKSFAHPRNNVQVRANLLKLRYFCLIVMHFVVCFRPLCSRARTKIPTCNAYCSHTRLCASEGLFIHISFLERVCMVGIGMIYHFQLLMDSYGIILRT